MRKIYLPLLAAVALVPAQLKAYDGVTWDKHYDSATKELVNAESGEEQAKNWMADLPDNMFLAHVSIPGTHDSATGGAWASDVTSAVGGPLYSTTQSALIDEMMDRGVRGWDIRPGYSNNTVVCAHGDALLKLTLKDAMKQFTEFLTAHPTEFFVMHLFRGNVKNGESDAEKLNSLLNEIFNTGEYANFIVPFNPMLTVGDMRGKILLIRRDAMSYANLPNAGYVYGWSKGFNYGSYVDEDKNTVYYKLDNSNSESIRKGDKLAVYGKIYTQDWSDGDDDLNIKKEECVDLLDWASAQNVPNDEYTGQGSYRPNFVMNFTSRGSSTSDYENSAKAMTPIVNEWFGTIDEPNNLGKGPVGIMMSDWVLRTSYANSDLLIYNIIANNFVGGETSPVERFKLDSQHDWTLPEVVNPFEGQTFFMRNIGATDRGDVPQYFGGGANYGAHAVTNHAGHTVKFEALGNDDYFIDTPYNTLLEIKDKGGDTPNGQYYLDGEGSIFRMIEGEYMGRKIYYFTESGTDLAMTAIHYADNNVWNPYFDRPVFYVDPKTLDYNDPYQMWEFIPYEDRVAELNNATPNRPLDATFYVPAYSFGNSDETESEWSSSSSGAGLLGGGVPNNSQANEWRGCMWRVKGNAAGTLGTTNVFTLKTTVSGLPNGNYKLYVQAVASNNPVTETITPTPTSLNGGSYSASLASTTVPNLSAGGDDIGAVGEWFAASADNGKREMDIKVTNGQITIQYANPSKVNKAYSFYLDNIRLTYLGPDGTAEDPEETVEIDFPNEWNTLILPFDAELPDGLALYTIDEIKTHWANYAHYFDPVYVDSKTIKANTPYLVQNPEAPKLVDDASAEAKASRRRAGEAEYNRVETFSGVPVNTKDIYGNGILYGTISGATIDEAHYQLDQTAVEHVFNANTESNDVPANRAYINSTYKMTDEDGNQTPLTLDLIYFGNENVVTGVEDVATDEADMTDDTPVDVYNAGGVLVRSKVAKADALTDLPRGIYILTADGKSEKMVK